MPAGTIVLADVDGNEFCPVAPYRASPPIPGSPLVAAAVIILTHPTGSDA